MSEGEEGAGGGGNNGTCAKPVVHVHCHALGNCALYRDLYTIQVTCVYSIVTIGTKLGSGLFTYFLYKLSFITKLSVFSFLLDNG